MHGPTNKQFVSYVDSALQTKLVFNAFFTYWKPYKEEAARITQENLTKTFCKHLVGIKTFDETARTFWVRYSASQYRTVNIFCYLCAREFVVSVLNGVQEDKKDVFLGLFVREFKKKEQLIKKAKREAALATAEFLFKREGGAWLI